MSRKPDTTTTEAMYEKYNSGLSISDVASRFGVSRQTVHKRLVRAGKKLRPQLRYGKENHFYRGGYTQSVPAQKRVQKLISQGKIKPQPCEQCGKTGSAKDGRNLVHAHHDDYRRPECVRWLCQPCHHEWHKNNRATPCHV